MPIEIYKDPATGEERRRWVAPKGMAKPKAQPKQQGNQVLDIVRNAMPVVDAVTSLGAAGVEGIGAGIQEFQRSGDPMKALGAYQQGAARSIEGPGGPGKTAARMLVAGSSRAVQGLNDTVNNVVAAASGERLAQSTTAENPNAKILGIAPPLPDIKQDPTEKMITDFVSFGAEMVGLTLATKATLGATAPALGARLATAAPRLAQAGKVVQQASGIVGATLKGTKGGNIAITGTKWATEGALASAGTTFLFQDPHGGTLSDQVAPFTKGTALEPLFNRLRTNPNDKGLEAQVRAVANDVVWGVPFGIGFGAAGAGIKQATAKFIAKSLKHAAVVDNAAAQAAAPTPAAAQTVDVAATPVPVRMSGKQAPVSAPQALDTAPTDAVERSARELVEAHEELQAQVAKELEPPVAPQAAAPAPVKLYRGTKAGSEGSSTVGDAFFMSPDRKVAEAYAGKGGTITEQDVSFRNLLEASTWMKAKEQLGLEKSATMDDLIRAAREAGYDGLSFTTKNGKEYVQIPAAAAPEPSAPAPKAELPDTRGQGEFYHGAAKEFELSPGGEYSGDGMNIYGNGFYATEDLKTASAYQKKNSKAEPVVAMYGAQDELGKAGASSAEINGLLGRGKGKLPTPERMQELSANLRNGAAQYPGTAPAERMLQLADTLDNYRPVDLAAERVVYRIKENQPIQFFDLDAPVTSDIRKRLRAAAGYDEAKELVNDSIGNLPAEASLAQIMDEIRAGSKSFNVPAYEVQEIFENLIDTLKKDGYGGFTHVGGKLAAKGKRLHQVRIYWDPAENIALEKFDPNAPAAAAAPEPSVPSAGSSAPVAGPSTQEIQELDELLARARADLPLEQRIALRDQQLAEKYGTGSPVEPPAPAAIIDEVMDAGSPPEPPAPAVVTAIEPTPPEQFIERFEANLDAIRSGEMDMKEAMSSDIRRLASPSGNTVYRPSAPEELIASNRALHDMLVSRAEATGIQSFNVQDVYQEAARRLARDGMNVDLTVKRLEAARAGDPRSQEDLVAHAAVILHRDETARQNGVAAIEFLNNTDEAVKADAMRRLWAGMEDQTKLDNALMTATRKDAQRLRLNQGPERVVFVNAREVEGGTILRHGTSQEAGQAILQDGFEASRPGVGILGEGVYFTTKDTYAGVYGEVEVFGDLPSDIRILDLFSMDKSMSELLQDLKLGRLNKDGLLSKQQKAAIREWAAANGYDGIRYEADFGSKPNKSGVDEIVLFDTNAANRVVGSKAAVVPTPDLPDETVQQIIDQEIANPANSLLEKIDPEIRADIESGVMGPDAEALTEALARAAIDSRDTKGFGGHFAKQIKAVPNGRLTQQLILDAYRNSLLWSIKTWTKMILGSSYRSMTLAADQALASLGDAALQGMKGNTRGAAHSLRRAGLDMGIYLRMMVELPNALRLTGHSLKEGESFGNLGRTQMEVAQKGFSETDQMALEGLEMAADQGMRRTTLDNPFFLNPENKNMTAQFMRAGWKALSFSGRVTGAIDTFFSSLIGPSAEWARLMDLQLRQAEDLGMSGMKAWNWASDKTEELLEMQWAKVVTGGGETIEKAALTGKHAQVAMDWVNFTDPLDVKFQERSFEYGIRVAKDEGLTDPNQIALRAQEWMNEQPDAWKRAGMGVARTVSLAPKLFQDAVNNTPVVGILQSFNRGPTNITKAAMRATGFGAPFVDTFWRDINSEDVMTRNRAIGEIATGWLTAVTAVTLATSGYVELTGPGSLSPQVRQKMRSEGWRPFAIRFTNPVTGEKTNYFDLSPFDTTATIFAGVAAYLDTANNMPKENQEALANNLVLTVAETVRQVGVGQFTKGMYGGIMDIFDMFSDLETKSFIPVEGQVGAFEEFVQKKLTGFMPAVFRNIRRGADPYERVVVPGDWPYPFNFFQELGQRFMNEIPNLSENLPPRLHPITASPIPVEQVWGTQFIPLDQPWLRGLVQGFSLTAGMPMTAGSTDPVDNELRRLSGRGTAFIIWNGNEFQLPNYRLDQNQLNRLAEITRDLVPPGRSTSLHGSLSALVTSPEYLSLPEAAPSRATQSSRAIRINQEINYYKQFIKAQYRAENPDLDQRLTQIENQKIRSQNDAQMGIEAWTQRMTR